MNCVILQPSYIPWRGYFHQIQKADIFVFYDCVQYDHLGWRNRNQIKTPQGNQWLTIPVRTKGLLAKSTHIKDIPIICTMPWRRKHLATLKQNYGKAPHFKRYLPLLESFYARRDALLADFTCDLTVALARELGISHTKFIRSSTLNLQGQKTDRLLEALKQLGARHYISGPSARDYMEMEKFAAAGITVEFMEYKYPEYPQLHGAFQPGVTILDLLFNTGPDAARFIW
ncbi:MAG: WbqC family protein [Verrucomicrobiota bacterium]